MQKYILTDIDGVVLDWEAGFHEWMREHQNEFDHLADLTEGMYGVHKMYGVSKEKAKLFVNQFNESAAAAFLNPYREAEKYIPKIANEFGYRFVAVTSFGREGYSMALREQLLEETFGPEVWEEIHILDMGADKDDILRRLAKNPDYAGSIWVEDKPENAVAGSRAGFEALLMKHKHNEGMDFGNDEVYYIDDWKQIYLYVEALEEENERKAC